MNKILKFITNIGVDLESDELSKQDIKLINQYTLVVFFVFFIHALHNFFYIKDALGGYTLVSLSIFFLLTFVLNRLRRFKFLVWLVFIILCSVIFFFDSYSGIESGIYLYYFPLAMAVPFIFDFYKDKIYIFLIFLAILVSVIVNVNTGNNLFQNHSLSLDVRRNTFYMSFSMSLIIVAVDWIFIFRKNKSLYDLYQLALERESLLKKQQMQLNSLDVEGINAVKIKELTQLAINNDPSLFSAFNKLYPSFCATLLKESPKLSTSELEICIFTKLNFTTKDIAKYTKLSIRAIEGRKYRIRKKLNFNSEKEFVTWMMELDLTYIDDVSSI